MVVALLGVDTSQREMILMSLKEKKDTFEVCVCIVEKMNGSDYIRFKDILDKFADYSSALKLRKM